VHSDPPPAQDSGPAVNVDGVPAGSRGVRGLRGRVTQAGVEHGAWLLSRVELSLPFRCLLRFGAIKGRDRALVLGGQAFTTVIPLFIVVAAAASRKGPTVLADRLTHHFRVTGSSAQSIRVLFERPPGAVGAITITGVLLLLFSLLSLTRSLQRAYEAAWELPAKGVRGTLHAVTALGLLASALIVLSLLVGMVSHVPAGGLFAFVLRVLLSTAVWLVLQRLLLSRRVSFRRLLPGSVVAGAGSAVLSLYSALWMPRVIAKNSESYGIIGITFALLTWLIVVSFCIVVVAVVSAELGGVSAASGEPALPGTRVGEASGREHRPPADDPV
jgi:membrane protein